MSHGPRNRGCDRAYQAVRARGVHNGRVLNTFDDTAKVKDLRRMKLVATGFLLGVTLVYLLCLLSEGGGEHGWVSYVKSAAEAGMVGGLADWFAVTALFRHPLGIPIPHTAIIRKKKDQIGESLGSFVGENFLAPEAVLGKLESARIPERAGGWMAQPLGQPSEAVNFSD